MQDCQKRARKFIGQWSGSSGALAADVIRLLKEREQILSDITTKTTFDTTLDKSDFILNGEKKLKEETKRFTGDGILNENTLREGSKTFIDVLDEIKQMHLLKTKDYGSAEDALKNIRDGADVVNIESWKACLIRMADKMTRLRNFCHNGKVEFDGLEDTLLDLAAYSVIALVLLREATGNSKKLP